MPRVASPILTLHDDITITVGGREFQFPKQQVVDREPHSIISHAIEGPWADKEKLSFPDRSGEGFEGLVQYILVGFVPRELDFAALIAVPLNLLVCATVRAFDRYSRKRSTFSSHDCSRSRCPTRAPMLWRRPIFTSCSATIQRL